MAPSWSEYEPDGHGCLSEEPPVQKKPAGQFTVASEELFEPDPSGQNVPGGDVHGEQVLDEFAPIVAEYVPAGHRVHELSPTVESENRPDGQNSHDPLSFPSGILNFPKTHAGGGLGQI